MADQAAKATAFTELHSKGSPVILFNSWDPGSTKVIAEQGAKAMALGSHGVAEAFGYEDGQNIPLELVFENARRVVESTDLPVSLDFESGYGATSDEVKASVMKALKTGVIGFNIEDVNHETGELYSLDDAVERLKAVKAACDEFGVPAHINARTDLVKNVDPSDHDEALIDQALERAAAFKEAGANSFFAPLVVKKEHMQKLIDESPLPVNIIWLPDMNMPEPSEIAEMGAARISYGPGPWLAMKEWLGEKAKTAFENQD